MDASGRPNTMVNEYELRQMINGAVVEARTAVAREIISAYDDMLDGMGKGQDDFKKSDWDYVQSLKFRYQGEKK